MTVLALPADATDTGLVPGDFAVIQYTNWNTTWYASLKNGVNWTLVFGTPAPSDGSGRLGYLGMAPAAVGIVTLGDYLDEVRRLLHDQSADPVLDIPQGEGRWVCRSCGYSRPVVYSLDRTRASTSLVGRRSNSAGLISPLRACKTQPASW